MTLDPWHVATASLALLALGIDLGLIALALGAATRSRGTAIGITTALAAASYLLSSLAPVVHWLRPAALRLAVLLGRRQPPTLPRRRPRIVRGARRRRHRRGPRGKRGLPPLRCAVDLDRPRSPPEASPLDLQAVVRLGECIGDRRASYRGVRSQTQSCRAPHSRDPCGSAAAVSEPGSRPAHAAACSRRGPGSRLVAPRVRVRSATRARRARSAPR